MSKARIGVWTIRLMADSDESDERNQEVHDIFKYGIGQIESKLSDALPEGFYVKIEDH